MASNLTQSPLSLFTELLSAGTLVVAAGVSAETIYNNTFLKYDNQYTKVQTAIFPTDLVNSSNTPYMMFNFYQYQRPSVFTTPFTSPIGAIILPLPTNLKDGQAVSYIDNESTNPAIGAALDGAIAGYQQSVAQKGNSLQNLLSTVEAGVKNVISGGSVGALANSLDAGGAAIGLQNGADRILQIAGLAVNPYLTVLFKSPVFKRHTFVWKFIPNNFQESETLKFIINKFKYHQLPDTNQADAGSLLQYPDVVRPIISPSGYVYSFKHCVIEQSSVNYSPASTPSFNRSNAPSAIEFSIQLLEIEYFLKGDLRGTDPNYSVNQNISLSSIGESAIG